LGKTADTARPGVGAPSAMIRAAPLDDAMESRTFESRTGESRTDVAVVGGGKAGVSTALFLARAGRQVTLLERGSPWGDASGANAGTISFQVKRTEVLPLIGLSIQIWERFGTEMGAETGFKKIGGYRVATTAEEVAFLRSYAAEQAGNGLEYEWLEANQARARAPWLGPSVRAATFCEIDAFSSPLISGGGLLNAARQAGVTFRPHAEVTALARAEDGYTATTAAGTVSCKTLVIAAGPWSARLAKMLGADFPFYVDVNMLSVTEPAPFVLDRIVTHIGGILSLKQMPNGTVLIGGGWQGWGKFGRLEKEVDHVRLGQNLGVACAVVPALRRLRLVRSWAGYEAVAPDALPVFGALPGLPGAYVVAGARGGYSMGPGQGYLVSQMILGEPTAIDVRQYDPARLKRGRAA
jgi:glycine/D-amino acid oxidase-like deaminating enzyme